MGQAEQLGIFSLFLFGLRPFPICVFVVEYSLMQEKMNTGAKLKHLFNNISAL